MENKFAIFDYKNLGSVRTYLDEIGEVWFCLADVTNVIGISNNRNVKARLNENGVHSMDIIDSMNRIQTVIFIDEGNLYQCILGSRKKEVKPFVDWVTREVIPSIRKTGRYSFKEESLPAEALRIVADGFERQEKMNKGFKKDINYLTGRIIHLEEENYSNQMIRQEIIRTQNEVIRNSCISVYTYAVHNGIDPNSINTNKLGRIASKLCRERGIDIAKLEDKRWGYVNAYPHDILEEIFHKEIYNGN